ncbi:MAG: hypothetical protein ABWY77_07615 [Acidimicrobiia bacterium]
MEAWREQVSPQVQNEFDYLASAAMPFATEMLERHGSFFPFAATLDIEDRGHVISASDDSDRREPPSEVQVEALLNAIRADADVLKCAAITANVVLEDGEAIRMAMEHRGGQTLVVLVPYRKKRLGRGVSLAEAVVLAGERHIW